tara:strand:+ start:100 stop:201 length:102 start_codon:yes stop_codon:yes gene_type:complete
MKALEAEAIEYKLKDSLDLYIGDSLNISKKKII